jgi:hypothetical protein
MEDEKDYLNPAENPLILVPGKETVDEESETERAKRIEEEQAAYEAEEALVDPATNPMIDSDTAKGNPTADDVRAPMGTPFDEPPDPDPKGSEDIYKKLLALGLDSVHIGDLILVSYPGDVINPFHDVDGRTIGELELDELAAVVDYLDKQK